MKTKWSLSVLFFAACITGASAQGTANCEEIFRTYQSQIRSREYNNAVATLEGLRKKCPKFDSRIYTYGEQAFEYKIEASRTPEERKANVDNLYALYSEYEKNFPGKGADVKRALFESQQGIATEDEVYKTLDAAFNRNMKSFTDYKALETYFNLYLKRYQAGDKGITQEQFIQKYGDLAGQVAAAQNIIAAERSAILKKQETQQLTDEDRMFLAETEPAADALEAVGENMEKQAKKFFTCDKLESYYANSYEAHKTNAAWLEGMVNTMFGTKCFTSATLQKGVQALYELKPDAKSAYNRGYVAMKKKNMADAITYFEKSAAMETSLDNKADLYMDIAMMFRNSDKAQAKKYAKRAAETNPKFAKPYLFLAEMYTGSSKDCGLSDFDRKALTWLAIDNARKAEAAEARYKSTVASLLKSYDKKIPTKAEVKAAGKKSGDTVTFGCWINESVTIPKL